MPEEPLSNPQSPGNGSRVHWIAYESPLAAFTACNQPVRYINETAIEFRQRGTLSTDRSHVTCKRCLAFLDKQWAGPAPRVLPPSDEVPY